MDAVKFVTTMKRICRENACTDECPLKFFCKTSYECQTKETIEKTAEVVEEWVKEHPIKTRLSEFKRIFPDGQLNSVGYPNVAPCTISTSYNDKKCDEMTDCSECRKKYWDEEI